MESYRRGETDPYFDAALYAALLVAVQSALRVDRMEILMARGNITVQGEEQLREYSRVLDEPVPEIAFLRGADVVAIATSEPYVHAGGPDAYHDSYTVPFFTSPDAAPLAEEAVREACLRLGATVTDTVVGRQAPTSRWILGPLWFLSRLFG